ncbi:aldehyde dehydrogenase family protein [Mycobacterium kansasii]|uniref:Aldehyde dehydrogenase family protein n=1 Tax=Mycobacterium kansasii TaxID=1768 RepID=A0A1V3XIR0_MYCKA|nr:aldehyde dehydrogenase family protein [Mycobacterium kansasii]
MAESPLVDSYQLYIGGRWVEPHNGRYDDISPSTGATIATAPDASVGQVAEAIEAARRAFDEGPWPAMSHQQRAGCLTQLGEALKQHADEFFSLSQAEWGCTANERMMQIDSVSFIVQRAGQLATTLREEPIGSVGAGATVLCHEPLGVVSILTPWNFPHSLNAMKVSRALAAGNTVVLKPSPLTPLAGLALAKMIDEHTDIPPGVVNVVTPGSIEASKLLAVDPRIDMVSFTGSSAVGREVMAAAAGTMKRVLLECGGKSASIVLDDAALTDELLQRMLFESCLLHAGQACILQSRLLLPDAMHDDVVDRLVGLARQVKVGDPADPGVQMGPLISEQQRQRVEHLISRALGDGATLATGGRRPPALETGFYYEPTILTGSTPDATIAQEEVFGPVVTVMRYRDDDEAVAIANNSQYGLSGAVWAPTLNAPSVSRAASAPARSR